MKFVNRLRHKISFRVKDPGFVTFPRTFVVKILPRTASTHLQTTGDMVARGKIGSNGFCRNLIQIQSNQKGHQNHVRLSL
jgi:hypothetical protein